VDAESEGNMSTEFYREQERKARKTHKCDLCKTQIEIGESYHYESGKFDGNIFETHICNNCKPLQEAFFTINRNDLDEGYTWDDVIDDINEIVCYDCRKESGDCEFGYYEVPKCKRVKEEYLKFANA
jgi:hypothetical protein